MSGSSDPRVDAWLSEVEIGKVLLRYATALDSRDWELLETCFVPDVRVTYLDGASLEDRASVVAFCRSALERYALTQHAITNSVIDVATDGETATATCYLRAEHVYPQDGTWQKWTLGGRYVDHLRHTPEGWRIVERRLLRAWDVTVEIPTAPST